MGSAKKELKEVIQSAEDQGWRVKTTKKGHKMFLAPDGINKVTGSGTPSDHAGLDNLIGDLRRYDFEWKGR